MGFYGIPFTFAPPMLVQVYVSLPCVSDHELKLVAKLGNRTQFMQLMRLPRLPYLIRPQLAVARGIEPRLSPRQGVILPLNDATVGRGCRT